MSTSTDNKDLSATVTEPTTEPQTTAPVVPPVPMPYNDRFSAEVFYVRGTPTDAGNVWLSSANLYLVSLAILAECECLAVSGRARETELLKGYNKVVAKKTVNNVTKKYEVSIYKIAKEVVDLYDTYYDSEFLECTMLRNWRWTSTVEEGQYDPFRFSRGELQMALCDAGMGVLVKGMRLYLMETVKHFFLGVRDEKEWGKVHSATYKIDGIVRSSADFTFFVESMMTLYNCVNCLSPSLDEIKEVVLQASEAGKKEFADKRGSQTSHSGGRSGFGSRGPSSSFGSGKRFEHSGDKEERHVTTYFEPTRKETTDSHRSDVKSTPVAFENKWKAGNPLVKKPVVEKTEDAVESSKDEKAAPVHTKEARVETFEPTRPTGPKKFDKGQSLPQRRVVRSGKPEKKEEVDDDAEGWTTVESKHKAKPVQKSDHKKFSVMQ